MLNAIANLGGMNWSGWVIGLWSSFISAAAGAGSAAIGTMIVDPVDFNIHDGLRRLLQVMLVSALIPGIVSLLKYLQLHPVPDATMQGALADAASANVQAGAAIAIAQDKAAALPSPPEGK